MTYLAARQKEEESKVMRREARMGDAWKRRKDENEERSKVTKREASWSDSWQKEDQDEDGKERKGDQNKIDGEEGMSGEDLPFNVNVISISEKENILSGVNSERVLSSQNQTGQGKILSRQKRQFPIFGFLSFLMLLSLIHI